MQSGKILNLSWWQNLVKYQPLAQRVFLFLNLSPKFPKTLNIEPTNNCNLSCIFCPTRKTNRPFGFMDYNFYRKIIKEIVGQGKLEVLWLNKDGEPLLHPQLDKMISLAKKKKAAKRLEVYTNGLLLNEEMAKKIIFSGLDSLVISVDATDEKSFKKMKQNGDYKKLVSNINNFLITRKKLKKSKPLLTVKMVNLGNRLDIEKFQKQWQNLADSVIVQPLHNWEGSVKITNYQLPMPNAQKRYPCNLPWLAPAITWDGLVVPCCVNYLNNELVMGDLKKQSLVKIWGGEKFKRLRLAHLERSFNKYPTCLRCQYWRQLPNMELQLRRLGV